jgi:hypothetical protein
MITASSPLVIIASSQRWQPILKPVLVLSGVLVALLLGLQALQLAKTAIPSS